MSRGRRKPAPPKRAGCLGTTVKLVTGVVLVLLFLAVVPWLPMLYLALIGTVGVFKALSASER